MMRQPIYDIAKICHLHGVVQVVVSPGSRSAPLVLAFNRHGGFTMRTIPDERSAAFIALGLAEKTGIPTVLICTSGTAVLNYAPAIAEAHYRHIPLLVLTADRPREWIDQWDGQTINQTDIYAPHIKRSFTYPDSFEHPDKIWHAHRIASEALLLCMVEPRGPVHINIPLREPLYPSPSESLSFSSHVHTIRHHGKELLPVAKDFEDLLKELLQTEKAAIVVGQHPLSPELVSALTTISAKWQIPVIGDIISNIHGVGGAINRHDALLPSASPLHAPDLLITLGQSLISKNLKLFLRQNQPKAHWHIAPFPVTSNPFQSQMRVMQADPAAVLKLLGKRAPRSRPYEYLKEWKALNEKSAAKLGHTFVHQPFGEFEAVYTFLGSISEPGYLHLANSMPVRYASCVGLSHKQKKIEVFANRGTSGIDGSSSTAVGIALCHSNVPNYLITGDVSFFYDINAFWHNYRLKNLKILLLNNHGGGIFRLLPGSQQQPELEEFFETHQPRTALGMAREFGFSYFHSKDRQSFQAELKAFFKEQGACILEVETDKKHNQMLFQYFKTNINT